MGKVLKVSDRKIYNNFLVTGLPASILLGQTHLYGYYLENYLQAVSCINNFNEMDFSISDALDYLHHESINKSIIDYEFKDADFIKGMQKASNLEDFILTKIEADNYIIAFMDEYYITGREAFQNYHYVHEALIFGYDVEFFDIMAFSHGIYQKQKWMISEVIKAIWNGKDYCQDRIQWIFEKYISSYHIKQLGMYVADKNVMINKLKQYLVADEVPYTYDDIIMSYHSYGIDCINILLKRIDYYIENLKDPSKDDKEFYKNGFLFYRAIHHFTDYKIGLNERIMYIMEYEDACRRNLYEKNVMGLAERIRLLCMKAVMLARKGIGTKDILQRIRFLLVDIQIKEKYTLEEILEYIAKG